jgi:hypothetical protein
VARVAGELLAELAEDLAVVEFLHLVRKATGS